MTALVIGAIGRHPSRPERLALLRPDGSVGVWFACDQTIADVQEVIRGAGFEVRDDGTVLDRTASQGDER